MRCLGRRLVYAADEYYLLAGRPSQRSRPTGPLPSTTTGWAWPRPSRPAFAGRDGWVKKGPSGFFRSLEGAPALGYRAPRAPCCSGTSAPASPLARAPAGATVLTGEYGARVLGAALSSFD